MKRTTIILMLIAITLTSCVTGQKVTVYGYPGTVISTVEGERLSVVDNTGKANIKLKFKEGYTSLLTAQSPGQTHPVPFALDYRERNATGDRIRLYLGLIPPMWFLWIGRPDDESAEDYRYLPQQTTNNDIIQ